MLEAFGRIDGVIHAAGVTSGKSLFRPLLELQPEDWRCQLHPKAQGMASLDEALDPALLRVFISSNATVLGGLGLAAYAAALQHAEAVGATGGRWRCITWDGWPGGERSDVRFGIDQFALDAERAGAAMEAAVALPHTPLVHVSAGDLRARCRTWVERRAVAAEADPVPAGSPHRPSVALPRSETEKQLAVSWCELLGLRAIGVDESFFALG